MKTKQCRFLLSLLAVLLFCLLLPRAAFAEEAEDPPFSGSRTLTYEIDTGLLPNYLSGGRTALDTYLRAYQPDWLTVSESRDDAGQWCLSVTAAANEAAAARRVMLGVSFAVQDHYVDMNMSITQAGAGEGE